MKMNFCYHMMQSANIYYKAIIYLTNTRTMYFPKHLMTVMTSCDNDSDEC